LGFEGFEVARPALLVRAVDAYVRRDRALAGVLKTEIEQGKVSSRNCTWIPIEIILDYLGAPLAPVVTQWLEPYEDVRRRWVGQIHELCVKRSQR
jgi:hypothetical protein